VNNKTSASTDSPSRRPIRLLQLVHGYPPAVGGVEIAARDRCERLVAEHGFEVTVLTTDRYTVDGYRGRKRPTIPIQQHEVQNGVEVRRFPVRTGFAPLLGLPARVAYRVRAPGNDLLRTLHNGPICPGMLRAARSFQPDVICAASFPLNHMRYPFRLPEPRPPIVLIGAIHTNDDWGFNRPNLLRLVNRSHATIAHTDTEREWLIAHGADPSRVRVMGVGIDRDALRPRSGAFRTAQNIPDDGYLVAYFGQLAAHKGIQVLIGALPTLLARRPNAWLAVAGSKTPFTERLEQLVRELPRAVRARIRLLTDIDDQTKADLLGACDVFASPSQAESFGFTTVEAWSLAKPVVVGDAPSQRSVVADGTTGLVVPYGDQERLIEALERLADPELRDRLGRAGREVALERYDRRKIDAAYAELFKSAAEGPGLRA
jgi:glycosyltransferase involved in cell wall biosynthesis